MAGHLIAKFGKRANDCCAIIPYAARQIFAPLNPSYLTWGGAFGVDAEAAWTMPRDGTLDPLVINVDFNDLTGVAIYKVRISRRCNQAFADSGITISVPAATTGCFESNKKVKVKKGDRVSLELTATGVTSGSIRTNGGLSVGPP